VGPADAPHPVAGKSEVAARFQTLFSIETTAGQVRVVADFSATPFISQDADAE
jgi:hypothetical protein